MADRPSYSWLQSAKVVSADLDEDDELRVRFDDDIECVLDLTEATNQGHGAFAELEYVQRVSIDAQRRKLVWPNGFEVDTDMLHAAAALEEFERTLGLEHPETLAARFRLALLYVAADDLESARAVGEPLDDAPEALVALTEQFLADVERERGADDPEVKAFRDGLHDALRAAGIRGTGATTDEQTR
jgi:hypothetical protein